MYAVKITVIRVHYFETTTTISKPRCFDSSISNYRLGCRQDRQPSSVCDHWQWRIIFRSNKKEVYKL